MAKVIWRAGKIAIMVLLPLMVLGVILFLVKSGTFAQVVVVPTAEEPAAVVTEDTAVAQWVAEQVEAARVCQKQGDNDQAFGIYANISQQYPGTSFDLQVRVLQVKLCILEKDIPAAETITQGIINDFSGHEDLCATLYDISYDYWNNDQCAKGKVLYDYIIQNFPGNTMAFKIQALMARCEIRLGNTEAADQAVNGLMKDYSGHKDLYAELYALVNEYFWKLEHAKYESLCEYISQNSSDSSIAAKALIRLELNMENLAAAEQAMIDFKADFPEDQTLYPELNEIADRFNQQKNLDIAKACFQYVYQDSSDSNLAINARKWAATIEIQLGNDSAAESLIRALKNDHAGHPQLFTKLNELAGDFFIAGSPDKAKALYDYVYQNSPDKEIAYSSLAESLSCEVRLGNRDAFTQAIESLNAEDGTAEDYVDRVQAVCRLYIGSGDPVAAITCINRAIKASPNHPKNVSLLELKAKCYINMGMVQQAQDVQEEIALLATDEEYIKIQRNIADKYKNKRDYNKAIEIYRHIFEICTDKYQKLQAYNEILAIDIRNGDQEAISADLEYLERLDYSDKKTLRTILKTAQALKKYYQGKDVLDQMHLSLLSAWPTIDAMPFDARLLHAAGVVDSGTQQEAQNAIYQLINDYRKHPNLPWLLSIELGENYFYSAQNRQIRKKCPEQVTHNQRKAIIVWKAMASEFPEAKEVPQASMWTGYCYKMLGEYGKAIQCFQHALDVSPDFYCAWNANYLIAKYTDKMYENKELTLEEAKSLILKAASDYDQKYPNSKACSMVKKLADKYSKLQ